MMRRLSYSLVCLLMMGGLFSCSREEEKAWDGPVLKMNVWCRNTVETRTSVAGDESRNENFISRVDFFFYPGEQTSSAASYHFYQEPNAQGNASFLK